MLTSVVDNSNGLAAVLAEAIAQATDVRIAVAFASAGGVKLIEAPLLARLSAGAHVEFIVGMDLTGTDPKALWALYALCQAQPDADLYCYARLKQPGIYHPKLYMMGSPEGATAIIGSSNLTEGGLKHNNEVNAVIRGTRQEEAISDAYSAYNRLKFGPYRVAPDHELLDRYRALHEKRAHHVAQDPQAKQLAAEFEDKVKKLHGPMPTRLDLVGWLELVYDHLPEGEFSNQQVYTFAGEFSKHYPDNRNVKAKIRQQLQVLAEMGLIKHVRAGRWSKL